MAPKRMYLVYTRPDGGEVGLPWIALTMMSLVLAGRPMTVPEITMDLAEGDEEKARAIYSSVYNSIRRLDENDDVRITKERKYVPSAKGKRRFASVMNFIQGADRTTLSDSRLMG